MEGQPTGGAPGEQQPMNEEEMRRALEEELRRVRIEDLIAQSIASILNLSARRIVKEDEQDLDQARLGIDSARALAEVLPNELKEAIRPALTELQMLYTQHAQGGGTAPEAPEAPPAPKPPPPGPAAGPGKLWTPGRG